MKKGIVEVADIIVVNKADGELLPAARKAKTEYSHALAFLRPKTKFWRPPACIDVRAGPLPMIDIATERRQGNKSITKYIFVCV